MAKQQKQPEPVDDSYELRPNGIVIVTLDSEVHSLRRPKVGEYRKMRERLWDLQDEKVAITQRHRDEAEARAKDLKGSDEMVVTLDVRKRSRALTADLEELNEQWVREAFDVLADKPLVAGVDDWPTWLRESDFITVLVEHWRSVP